MDKQELQKTLFILFTTADSILSLPIEERTALQKRLMALPELQMEQVILILQNEQRRMSAIKKDLAGYGTKISALTQEVRDDSMKLKSAYAAAMEQQETVQAEASSENLLKQLDDVAASAPPKKKKFGIF